MGNCSSPLTKPEPDATDVLPFGVLTSFSFLGLPYEVRQLVYGHLFSESVINIYYYTDIHKFPIPFLSWRGNAYRLNHRIFPSIIYTNKQVSQEALEVFHRLLRLHVHVHYCQLLYPDDSAEKIVLRPSLPYHTRQQLRRVIYCPGRESQSQLWSYEGDLPRNAFPFSETPNLISFTIRQPLDLDFAKTMRKVRGDLVTDRNSSTVWTYSPVVGCETDEWCTSACTRALAYQTLTIDEKFALWEKAGLTDSVPLLASIKSLNSGGWLSQLASPHKYGGVPRSPESSSTAASVGTLLGQSQSDDMSQESHTVTDPQPYLRVPPTCAIIVEVEIAIYHLVKRDIVETEQGANEGEEEEEEEYDEFAFENSFDSVLVERFAIEIDARRQKVLSKRLVTL